MKKKVPTSVRLAATIFIIYGIFQLVAVGIFLGGPIYVDQSVFSLWILPAVSFFIALISIFEGVFLLDMKSYSFPLGIIVSILMLISIPIGTILGLIALFNLYDSRSFIRKKK